MRDIKMVDLQTQYLKIKDEIHFLFDEILASAAYINGPHVNLFSNSLSKFLNVKHVIPCGNGTDALQLALMAADLEPGDEVITTPFTFVSTVEVIGLLGLKPVFVDVCPDSFNMDTQKITDKITDKTKVIIPVHLFGRPTEMEPLLQLANKHELIVIEDAAQSLGAEYTFSNGKTYQTGTMGQLGTTSFFPSKNLGCYGDGGAVMTNDDELATKVKSIANHGADKKYHYDRVGINSRLDTLQAAVLLAKLPHLKDYNQSRINAAHYYDALLENTELVKCPLRPKNATHIFHQYTLIIDDGRDKLMEFLAKKGIPTAIYYPLPLHLQKAYSNYGYKSGDFPIAENLSQKVLSLPMHSELSEEQQDFIIANLKLGLEKSRGV
ncbi:MAG: DegT/DnrJ/EryC1/StrS family aminotransferase [Saprospirales bacterium]|nr:MAG: DegT/DnrJ/EryC1/StrS family aminotransferase [Saprospirales bacterium]